MGFRLPVTLLVLNTSFGFGQSQSTETLCDAASVTTIDQLAGVIVQKVMLRGRWGSNEATVYLPNKEVADGAVVLSHSAIHSNTGTSVGLLAFAFTLAHAGAAVIVPSRTLIWPPTPPGETEIWQSSAHREGAVVICAEHWLIDHTKIFNNGEPIVDEKNLVVGYRYAARLRIVWASWEHTMVGKKRTI